MIDIGINDGDYVVVKQQQVADNGDIVVAIVDDGATVKRFFKEKDHIRLQPENENMDPIIVDNCTIAGTVVFSAFAPDQASYSANRATRSTGTLSVMIVPASEKSSSAI